MFSTLGFICIGDKTSCGGTVITGSPTDTTPDGRCISRVGDQIVCKKGGCQIISGDNTMIVAGQPVAMHGSLTTMQCTCMSTNHNNKCGVGQTAAQQAAIPSARDAGLAYSPTIQALKLERHWLEFSLRNKEGIPFSGESYIVIDAEGESYEGALDGEGYARIDSVAPGGCVVTFPQLNHSASVESCPQK